MTGRFVRANGVDLWSQDLGPSDALPIVLINGACYQSIWWGDSFCEA